MDSDSSLDSELLGRRAGGSKKRKAASEDDFRPSSDDEESVSLDEESDWEERGTSSKKRGSTEKPARKRQARGHPAEPSDDDEEDEEDEPAGRRSGGRGRKAAAAESSDDEDRLEIDEEELIEDEADRKRLAAMTELQREFELATRAEKRNQELLRQKLLQKNDAKAAAAGAKAAKRVGRSKSGREEREEAAKKSAMEELKAARERKARGAEERARKREGSEEPGEGDEDAEERRERRRESKWDREGREDSDEGALSEDDLSDEFRAQDRERRLYGFGAEGEDEEDEAPFEDVKKIQVRRSRLEEWVNQPFFEDTLPGCMVRLPQPDNMGGTRYLLCQVVAVEARPPGIYKDSGQPWKCPYQFPPGSSERTNKWLIVERGTSQRCFPLAQVSNTGFDDGEFESWQRTLKDQGRPQISRRVAREVLDRLEKAVSYRYTAADVDRLLKEKKAKGQAPRNAALEKARLENELSHARENEDAEKIAELEAQVAALTALVEESKGRRRGRADMASLNKRNADMNFKNALDNVSNKVGAAAAQGGAEAAALDPFSRRATRPMIYWSTKRQSAAAAEDEAPASQEPAAAANGGAPEAEAAGEQQKRRGKVDMDAIVDLSGLDLSVLQRPARVPPLARKLLGPTWRPDPPPPGVPIVSLEEYKRSKGWA